MAEFMKDGVEISMPEMDKKAMQDMERCADFLARMIEKYGKKVLAEVDVENKKEDES